MKKMIIGFSLIGAFLVVSLSACDKVKDSLFPAFDTEISDINVVIPVTLASVQMTTSSTVPFNLDSTIKAYTANTFSIQNISSVKVKDLSVILNNADDLSNISNFSNVSITLASNSNTTPIVVANAIIEDQPATSLNIPAPHCPELKEYLTGNQLTYTITGQARRATTKQLSATVSVTVSIK